MKVLIEICLALVGKNYNSVELFERYVYNMLDPCLPVSLNVQHQIICI